MNPRAVNEMFKGVYKGIYTSRNLPVKYYNSVNRNLRGALKAGFGSKKGLSGFYGDLDINIQAFSGAKTYQLTRELQVLVKKSKTYNEFVEKALPVYEKHESWLVAEDTTVKASAIQAKFWKQAERDIDIFPNLRYSTIGQACDICSRFEGITAPVGAAIWNKYAPLNHFGCFCILIQEDGYAKLTSSGTIRKVMEGAESKVNEYFKQNVGITNTIFPASHPYFTEIQKKDRAFAKRNFDLPIK
ncbi:hypothetical protein ACE38W_14920 [Chitinophaga sp. Hz27]|uniref:hypothetical protein n=1 Tax=Chitinophaga sp. Hz27 TaxID=3347169 RepID=UPI0035DCD8EF